LAILGKRLAVSIPDTVLEEKGSLREKTAKLGQIARACAIYGVDVVEVFKDQKAKGEGELIRKILEYLETPQYLRKRIYPLDESLRYAGALPPLRIPSHKPKVPIGALKPGEVREGVSNGDGTVDIGLDEAPRLGATAHRGERITVRITSVAPLVAEKIPREKVGGYWGYTVERRTQAEVVEDGRYRVKLATSRLGTPLANALGPLREALGSSDSVKLIFGSPARGLYEMFGKGLQDEVSMVVNLFPGQQVETVRTEEAVFAGLGLVSLICAEKA
jgi:methyltransferase